MTAPAQDLFEFTNRPAKIKTSQLKKHGQREARNVTLVMRIEVEDVQPRALAVPLCSTPAEIEAALWVSEELAAGTERRNVNRRFLGMTELTSEATFTERHKIRVADLPEQRVYLVEKIHIEPVAGMTAKVVMVVVIHDPTADFMSSIGEQLRDPTVVTLTADPELPFADVKSERGKSEDDEDDGQGDLDV